MLPFEMDGRRFGTRLDVPLPGSHSEALLKELGYPENEVAAMRAAGIIRP
jgi:crotonobetainyl-CoA:carnitine CoA-transferase CaiB-like acyl-CoA transferase